MKRLSGARKAKVLIELASNSVGSQSAMHYYKLHLKQLLAEYDLTCEQLEVVE
jgi:transposase